METELTWSSRTTHPVLEGRPTRSWRAAYPVLEDPPGLSYSLTLLLASLSSNKLGVGKSRENECHQCMMPRTRLSYGSL